MKREIKLSASLLFVVCTLAWCEWTRTNGDAASQREFESYQKREGNEEAKQDIAQHRLKWKAYGRVSDFEARKEMLWKRLGVEFDCFSGCLGSESIERYTLDYNFTMRAYLVSVYGEEYISDVLGNYPESWRP